VCRNRTDFILTTSLDGHLKLWKKQAAGIEFVKHYRAHLGPVTAVSGSTDGTVFATVGADGCKVFDVVNFGEFRRLLLCASLEERRSKEENVEV
jgi:WD40 repeat protein